MRITPSLLNKIARDTVSSYTRRDHTLLAAYLCGSLFTGKPLLGGTADIDLFFIHDERVSTEREIKRMTDEVHLDIAHHGRDDYQQARELRLHPWLGYSIIHCKILYDPRHFMDFTQASVRGQFNQPENVVGRGQRQAENSRQIWLALHDLQNEPELEDVKLYMLAVRQAANAVACLSGPPLTDRRFLLQFPERAQAVGRAGLYPGLIGLLGGAQLEKDRLQDLLQEWEAAFRAVPAEQVTPRLHPDRFAYYQRAFNSISSSERPQDVLWPLLRTWVEAVELLPEDNQQKLNWRTTFQELGLLGSGFTERVAALDAYLDGVEELLDEWALARGIEREAL
jgi:hypothetical protein